ncbi:MAG: YitT family protein [Betaproteobacteria bacterium]|nr:YitT family protein [Betaproteobacteria bacterium]
MPLFENSNIRLSASILWNLSLLSLGAFFYAAGAQCIVAKQGFLTGGVYGTGLLIWYVTKFLDPPTWYFLLNIPLFALAWFRVGRQFLLYTAYGVFMTSVFGDLLGGYVLPIRNELYAAVAGGALCGAGVGICLRSMGSSGGLDVVAIMLRERWNIAIGRFSFCFNAVLFLAAASFMALDLIIVSIIFVFISSFVLEQVIGLFNHRKLVCIISDKGKAICEAIVKIERYGATLVHGRGAYSGSERELILTVTNNIALKRLEHLVFSLDEHALFIVENTSYVSGAQFSRRRYR